MDKYEYKLKTEQMLKLMENGAYNRAAEIADSIDWKRVRNVNMLLNVSNIYAHSSTYSAFFNFSNARICCSIVALRALNRRYLRMY